MRGTVLFLAAALTAFAQADTNVLTITASRQVSAQPDQATVTLYVTTDLGQPIDAALTLVKGTGFTAADFSNVTSGFLGSASTIWEFSKTFAFSDLSAFLAPLAQLNPSGAFQFTVQTSSQTAACPYPALISDARIQASKLAAAAGVTAGPIVSISQVSAVESATALYSVSGVLSITSASFASFLVGAPVFSAPAPSCSLTVQFALSQ